MTHPIVSGRGRPIARRALLALSTALTATLATSGVILTAPAYAQSIDDQPTPPRSYSLDANGVDLVSGRFYLSMTDVSIGTAEAGLSYGRTLRGGGYDDPYETGANAVSNEYDISIGSQTDNFVGTGGYSTLGTGAKLTLQASGDLWYIKRDGTRYAFSKTVASTRYRIAAYRATEIAYPDGRVLRIEYDLSTTQSYRVSRPSAVQSSDGFRLIFRYLGNTISTANPDTFARWMTVASVTATNSTVEYCTAANCSTTDPRWRTATYSWSADKLQETRTDPAGRSMTTTIDSSGRITAVRPAGATANRIAITYDANNRVATFQTSSGTWQYAYAYATAPLQNTTTVTSPTGLVRVVTTSGTKILTDRTGTAGTSSYEYNTKRRLTKVTAPEGNAVTYGYDARDNVTSTTAVAKGGATSYSVTASFPATCANLVTCNKPTSVTDARGAVTSYAYDPTHGGVTKITQPSPDGQQKAPETRFTYASLQASYYGPGGAVQTGPAIWKLSTTSECAAGDATANCIGTAKETRKEIGYAAPGPRTNLLPTSIVARAGDSSVSASQSMTYNQLGDLTAIDGPLAGAGDTTTYSFDPTGAIAEMRLPDPDGASPLGSQATRILRDGEGRVSETQSGSYPNGSAGTPSSFVLAQNTKSTFDTASGLKTTDTLLAGGAVVQLTQYKYDADRRLVCTAARISRAPQADACVDAGTGLDHDVIQQMTYGSDGRPASAQGGGTIASYQYTPNGRISTLTDGENNRTTYEYDVFDRLQRTRYPVAAKGANASSTTDYEELGYDENGNVISRRLRDNTVLGLSYDTLNRVKVATVPSTGPDDTNISYTYDLLGRVTLAAKNPTNQTSMSYDALGRKVGEANYYYSLGSQYDAAGRRTRLTWNDGFYVTYEYDQADAMTAVRENGGFVLASFGYDDLGRRKTLTRGNGTVTSYGYDTASRLTSLTQDLASTSQDVTLGFGYDGLSRIASRTSSNDTFSFAKPNMNRSYVSNGLNQYTQAGSLTPTYDGRGNVTGLGGQSYQYTAMNRLGQAPGVSNLFADSLERLDYVSAEGVLFANDGINMVSEVQYNGSVGPIARRYVFGPSIDEPLVWYEGAGTADRRYLHADEHGSIIAVTNGSGTATAINTYDEYGQPGANNQGRFQYTGQKWIASVGLYNYKARMYSPQLGRFMQTDPIGFAGGINLYGYVGSDPVNHVDPLGLQEADIVVQLLSGGANGSGNDGGIGSPGGELAGSLRYVGLMDNPVAPVAGEAPQDADIVVTGRRTIIPSPDQARKEMDRFVNCYLGGCTLINWGAITDPTPPENLRTSRGDPGKEERLLKARQDTKRIVDGKPAVRAGWKGSAYLFLELLSKIFK